MSRPEQKKVKKSPVVKLTVGQRYSMIQNEQAPAVKLLKDPDKWSKDKKFAKVVNNFKEFILSQGLRMLGLAANQVKDEKGKRIDKPFIAIKNPDEGCNVYINPEITEYIGEPQERQEFPLTHPKGCIVVPRYNKVVVSWYNPLGGKRTGVELEGLLAQAFQHLTDQVNGYSYNLLPYGHIHSGKLNAKRNDLCPCGSEMKCKRCCGVAD